MRQSSLLAALALALALPGSMEAQPRIMLGGGFSAPSGDASSFADPGYHAQVSLELGIPTLPVALRGDGTLHRLGAAGAAFADTEYLAGAGSVVFVLPGVGLQPYVLGGIGQYRVKSGPAGEAVTETDTGYHGGFGVLIGGLGIGAFAEIRYVHIGGPSGSRLVPLTLGVRL
jgi:hypothetical protein